MDERDIWLFEVDENGHPTVVLTTFKEDDAWLKHHLQWELNNYFFGKLDTEVV
jgi:hypothetical protein